MSPPIYTPDGSEVSEIVLPDGSTASEVIGPDGNVVFEAGPDIPDSEANQKLIHRWYLSEDSGPFTDQIGSADGTNNVTTQVTGDWTDGAARDGDGTDDYIDVGTLDSFGSNMSGDFAVAFSFRTTNSSTPKYLCGSVNGDTTRLDIGFDQSAGQLRFQLRDSGGDFLITDSTGTNYNDGSEYRAVFNKTGDTAEIWVNQTKENENTNSAFGDPTDFSNSFVLFARNANGTIQNNCDSILDDFCLFNDSLTQTEIESYNNPWK